MAIEVQVGKCEVHVAQNPKKQTKIKWLNTLLRVDNHL